MEKVRRLIDMAQPDGSFHKVVVSQADVTNNGEIVVSYADYTDGRHYSFAELVYDDGVYYRNPTQNDWNYYVRNFQEHDQDFSNSVLSALDGKVNLFDGKDKKVSKEEIVEKKEENKTTAYFLTAIMYANRGESMIIKDKMYDSPPIFFTHKILDKDSLKEEYKKMNVHPDDHDELLKKINLKFPDKVNISNIGENLLFEVSSGNRYYINFSSCDNEELFWDVCLCDEIKVDISLGIQSGLYPDNLSAALHHELPLQIITDGDVETYYANSNKGHKSMIN